MGRSIVRGAFTVAVIGADGAGKTTVAKRVAEITPLPTRYLYMGMNPQANRFALPTSRLSYRMKHRAYRKSHPEIRSDPGGDLPDLGHVPQQRGPLFAAARLVNRLVEEWIRQVIAWRSHRRGHIVICDRHFVLDFAAHSTRPRADERFSDRLHRWLLAHLYPYPDLVVFLDAPAELLFERKQDASIEYLRERQASLAASEALWPHFRRVDATRPLDAVVHDVVRHIQQFQLQQSAVGSE